jgi:hypothetical protein
LKFAEEIMEILAAFDLTRSFRDAGELAGCSHHTVGHHVARREAGLLGDEPARRAQILDDFLDKIEEWVEESHGKIRADVAHKKLVAMGYQGSERTSRRGVAMVKASFAAGNRRVYRPWIPEPGMWFQYDFGDGPTIDGRATTLYCAWLAWCRFRVVLAILDKALPTVIACIDTTLRRFLGYVGDLCQGFRTNGFSLVLKNGTQALSGGGVDVGSRACPEPGAVSSAPGRYLSR